MASPTKSTSLLLAAAMTWAACTPAASITQHEGNFWATRAAGGLLLSTQGPSPQPTTFPTAPPGAVVVDYPSGTQPLPALMHVPDAAAPVPGVVYVHGGFGMDAGDYDVCAPFVDAGYALLVPTWRGEDGNPGSFELMGGELDDLTAAIAWFRLQPGVDAEHVYVFGHSVGGNLAALSTLSPDGARLTGSAGGLYLATAFDGWAAFAPFDVADSTARDVRLVGPWLRQMQRPHIAYVGDADPSSDLIPVFERAARDAGAPLRIERVPGTHGGSLAPAIQAFIGEIERDRSIAAPAR